MRNVFGLFQNTHQNDVKDNLKHKDAINSQSRARASGNLLNGEALSKQLDVIAIRLAETPQAVTALHFVLDSVLKNPKDQKRKMVNVTKPVFHRTIGKSKEWGIRFLEAMGFVENSSGDSYILPSRNESRSRLEMGLEKLDQVKQSEVYLLADDKIKFSKEANVLLNHDSSEENIAKQEHFEMVPKPPVEGSAGSTKVRIYFGDADINRIFMADDTLQAVLHWISAELNTNIVPKIKDGEFELIDRTVYPPKKISLTPESIKDDKSVASHELDLTVFLDDLTVKKKTEDKTLQSLHLWPNCELEIQKAGFHDRERSMIGIKSSE